MEIKDDSLILAELKKKDEELNNLKLKTQATKIITNFKIVIALIIILVEVLVVAFLLEKYGIIDDKNSLSNIISKKESNSINIPILDINESLTIEYANKVIDKMEDWRADDSVKEILVVMNCPGGSPVAADELTSYFKRFNQEKKINMYVQSMAASGGYYIASSVKPIIANQNAIVGSIGVIMPKYTIKDLSDKIGIKEDNVIVGDYKVPATIFSDVTEEQKEYLYSNLLEPTYHNFLNVIAKNRGLELDVVKKYANGKIFIANLPDLKNILVDEIMDLVTYQTSISYRLAKQYGVDQDLVKFNKIQNKKKGFNLFNIKLDLDDLKSIVNNIEMKI